MDAACQVSQIGERLVELCADRLQSLGHRRDPPVLQLLLRDPKGECDGDEPLLRSVVKIALDAVSRRIRCPGRFSRETRAASLSPPGES